MYKALEKALTSSETKNSSFKINIIVTGFILYSDNSER